MREVFSFLIQRSHCEGTLAGVSVTKYAPNVTHLYFADDSLLFGRVNHVESSALQNIIACYGG